jgi:hypothetical protein
MLLFMQIVWLYALCYQNIKSLRWALGLTILF